MQHGRPGKRPKRRTTERPFADLTAQVTVHAYCDRCDRSVLYGSAQADDWLIGFGRNDGPLEVLCPKHVTRAATHRVKGKSKSAEQWFARVKLLEPEPPTERSWWEPYVSQSDLDKLTKLKED